MKLLILLVLAITALAIGSDSTGGKKTTGRFAKKYIDGVPDGLELFLVNAIWRHGDRAPTEPFRGDVLTEADWTFGGGGYGELSPIGMKQHFDLGKKLWSRYAEDNQFLSELYKSQESYVHSTDNNRTLISAMSNFAGMYSRPLARKGTDYADAQGWPTPYVPVPIHTVDKSTDHMGDPLTHCNRMDDLWKLGHQTAEYINYANSDYTQATLNYLRDKTNSNADQINPDNIYHIWDGMKCQGIHFPSNVSVWYPWYTDEINQRTTDINNKNIQMSQGIWEDGGVIDGVDLVHETRTIRGGPILNEVVSKANGVLDCYKKSKFGEVNNCKDGDHFYQRLKYHVISSHDDTIYAWTTALGATMHIMKNGGYPEYSSAILTEFFIDTRYGGKDPVFRMVFHDDPTVDFRVVTAFIEGCPLGEDFCPLSVLQGFADKYKPPGGIDALCENRLDPNVFNL